MHMRVGLCNIFVVSLYVEGRCCFNYILLPSKDSYNPLWILTLIPGASASLTEILRIKLVRDVYYSDSNSNHIFPCIDTAAHFLG